MEEFWGPREGWGIVIYGGAGLHCSLRRNRICLLTQGRFLSLDANGYENNIFRGHERTGRPLGDEISIDELESLYWIDSTKDKSLGPKKR